MAVALAAGGPGAQKPSFDVHEIISRPHLTATGDGALGGALGYGIRFGKNGWELATSGGTREAPPCMLRFELETIGRRTGSGAFTGVRVADAASQVEGSTVRYARPGFVERYELRREGVEQSFVFDALPEGEGDLVVRGRLETDLLPSTSKTDVPDLRFVRTNGEGIAIGRITGIDARGVRVEGSMRYEGGQLDLVLPASFAENAVLPLVLDPLIGPTIQMPIGVYFDVAYDVNRDVYLVVWADKTFGPFYAHVLGQRVTSSGAFVGPSIQIHYFPGQTTAVRVTPAGNRPGFVVAYGITHDLGSVSVFANHVHSVSGLVGPRSVVRGGGSLYDIGTSSSGDAAFVLDRYSPATGMRAFAMTRLSIGPSGGLTPTGERTLVTANSNVLGRASMSTNAGPEDRHLVVWDEQRGTERNLFSAFLDSDLNLLDGGAIGLSSTNKHQAAVDGDGTKWCVAYQTTGTPASVGCFGVYWDPNSDSPYVTNDALVTPSGSSPVVAWTGDSYLIAYSGGAKSVDPFTCLPCEGDVPLPFPRSSHRIATPKSSSPGAGDIAMILSSGFSGETGTFFRADDGLITDLGGGCGRGGRAAATCAITGNAGFTLRVRGALPFAPAALVLGAAPVGVSCGPCTLVPNPASGITLGAGSTDRWGDARMPAPLPDVPSLVGAAFLEQWVIAGGSACLTNLDLSNALRVEIQ